MVEPPAQAGTVPAVSPAQQSLETQHAQHVPFSAAIRPAAAAVEIEQAGLVKDRIASHRAWGLSVTDIASAEWCQQQVAFKLTTSIPKARFCCCGAAGRPVKTQTM